MTLDIILPFSAGEDPPNKWDQMRLPSILMSMKDVDKGKLVGSNNIEELLAGYMHNLNSSKRIRSHNTRRNYVWNAKQFLVWCNEIEYDVRRCNTTSELADLVVIYNKILDQTSLSRNSIALKMQSLRRFFVFLNKEHQSMDIRAVFNADVITTSDPNAFKNQPRISKEVYDEIIEIVAKEQNMNNWWILFFLAHACRRSEISNAKVSDIDMVSEPHCINVYEPKTGSMKKIPVPKWYTGKEMFEENQVYIVASNSNRTKAYRGKKPVGTNHIYTIVQKWLAQSSMSDQMKMAPHSFRRYFINSMQKAGYSDSVIAKISGHKSPTMVARYGYDVDLESNPIITNNEIKY